MTIKQLIEHLQQMPPDWCNARVFIQDDDGNLATPRIAVSEEGPRFIYFVVDETK
jgi:hypothetical protein